MQNLKLWKTAQNLKKQTVKSLDTESGPDKKETYTHSPHKQRNKQNWDKKQINKQTHMQTFKITFGHKASGHCSSTAEDHLWT